MTYFPKFAGEMGRKEFNTFMEGHAFPCHAAFKGVHISNNESMKKYLIVL